MLIGLAICVLAAIPGTASVQGMRTEMAGQVNDVTFFARGSQTVDLTLWNDGANNINAGGNDPSARFRAGEIDACVLGDTSDVQLYDCHMVVCVPCVVLRPDKDEISVGAEAYRLTIYCTSTSEAATHIVEIVDKAMGRVIGTIKVHVGYPAAFSTCFVQTATGPGLFGVPGNISGHMTYVDNPSTNGNSLVRLIVTPNLSPNGQAATPNYHPIGVWYDSDVQKWAIYNEDFAPMPWGAAFNVRVLYDQDKCAPLASGSDSPLSYNGWIFLGTDNVPQPTTDYDWNAVILLTHNWSPAGTSSCCNYFDGYTGVWYHNRGDANPPYDWHWFIYRQVRGKIYQPLTGDPEVPAPAGLAFNTAVMGWRSVEGYPNNNVWREVASIPLFGLPSNKVVIDAGKGNPDAKLFVTVVGNPPGAGGTGNPPYGKFEGPIAVEYQTSSNKWAIVTDTGFPWGTAFNVVEWK
jgi:hypothetical protein